MECHRLPGQWVSPRIFKKLVVQECIFGKGVFADEDITNGERILHFGGPVLRSGELPRPYTSKTDHYLQIEKDRFLGPSGNLDDFVNHSCEPNAGLVFTAQHVELVAVCSIAAGSQITFDYSTTMHSFWWEMNCACGSGKCRRQVKNFDQLPEQTRTGYLRMGIVPGYVVGDLPKGSTKH